MTDPSSADPARRPISQTEIALSEARDLRVIHELFALDSVWGTVLQHRNLGGFPD